MSLANDGALMAAVSNQRPEELLVLQKCMEGDAQALAGLRNQHHQTLLNVVLARGASLTEADDLLADLWGDCVGDGDARPSLLEKYSGKCALQNWLITVATNRLIDLKRKQTRRKTFTPVDNPADGTGFIERVPGPASAAEETSLIDTLRGSLEQAFASCPAEGLLMLRLVYLHGLSQRELAAMWSCHEATISRTLAQALASIETSTLREVKRRDPWLDLNWQDFIELCETQQVGFL